MTRPSRACLTQRDEAVLLSLLKHRYLTTSQLRRLHFPSAQTAGRRLRRLRERGYVAAIEVPGVHEYVETLAERGAEAVAATLGVTRGDIDAVPWSEQAPSDTELRHALAVADFRIALTIACSASHRVALLGFVAGHLEDWPDAAPRRRRLVRHVVIDRYDPQMRIVHDPDAVFMLDVGGQKRLFFLEIDRMIAFDASGVRSFAHIVDFYENLRTSGTFKRYLEILELPVPTCVVRVLVVAASETRARALVAYAAALPRVRQLADLFWIAPRTVLQVRNIVETRWYPAAPRAVGGGDEHSAGAHVAPA